MEEPVIIDVSAPLHAVRTELVGLGAQAEQRSVVLSIGDHLLLVASESRTDTTLVIGGGDSEAVAAWLMQQLAGALNCQARKVAAESNLETI